MMKIKGCGLNTCIHILIQTMYLHGSCIFHMGGGGGGGKSGIL